MSDDHTRARTFDRLNEVLRDGQWHRDDELAAVAYFPEAWLAEFEREGHQIVRRADDPRFLRLAPQ